MIVYVLTAILVTNSWFDGHKVDVETFVFDSAERCYRNIAGNQSDLEKKYDQVFMKCTETKLVKGAK